MPEDRHALEQALPRKDAHAQLGCLDWVDADDLYAVRPLKRPTCGRLGDRFAHGQPALQVANLNLDIRVASGDAKHQRFAARDVDGEDTAGWKRPSGRQTKAMAPWSPFGPCLCVGLRKRGGFYIKRCTLIRRSRWGRPCAPIFTAIATRPTRGVG